MSLKPLTLLLTLTLLACTPPPPITSTVRAAQPSTTFDYYLLNLSWSPEFCLSNPRALNYPECTHHLAFILHGLWPQRSNQGPRDAYLQDCTSDPGPADPSKFADLYPDPPLLAHEWRTHGTCSGLAPDAYFALARAAARSVVIPATLTTLDHQISLPPGDILALFRTANPTFPAESFALSCGNNYLTAIEACLNQTGQPIPCPATLHSCRAQTVRIPPP